MQQRGENLEEATGIEVIDKRGMLMLQLCVRVRVVCVYNTYYIILTD